MVENAIEAHKAHLAARLITTRQQATATSMDVTANVDDAKVALLELSTEAVSIIPHLREQLGDMGVNVNIAKTVALPCRSSSLLRRKLPC